MLREPLFQFSYVTKDYAIFADYIFLLHPILIVCWYKELRKKTRSKWGKLYARHIIIIEMMIIIIIIINSNSVNKKRQEKKNIKLLLISKV